MCDTDAYHAVISAWVFPSVYKNICPIDKTMGYLGKVDAGTQAEGSGQLCCDQMKQLPKRDQETFSTNSEFADKPSFRRTKMIGSIWQNLGENAQTAETADDSGIFKTASFQKRLRFSFNFSFRNGTHIH